MVNRTEQFLSDLDEVKKGLPRHLKNIANQGMDIGDLLDKYPKYAERIYAHQMGRGTHLNDPDFVLRATGRTHPQTGKQVMSLGEAARAQSRLVPAGSKVSGFGRKVAQPVGIGQMTPLQRQNWVTQNTQRINRYRSRRNPQQSNPAVRGRAATTANAQPRPVTVTQAAPQPAFNASTFQVGPQPNTQLNTVARAHVAANAASPPPQHVHVSPPVQQAPTPTAQVVNHPQPSVSPAQAPKVVPPQSVPAGRENQRMPRWLRNSVGASLGIGTGIGAGSWYYQNPNRRPVKVRSPRRWNERPSRSR